MLDRRSLNPELKLVDSEIDRTYRQNLMNQTQNQNQIKNQNQLKN